MKLIDKKLIKFLLVGAINTLIGTLIMFILYNCFNINYWISSACNYIIGGFISFFLNKFFTFSNKEKSVKQIFLFIFNLITCYLISYFISKKIIYAILSYKSTTLQDNISLFVGMCFYTILNYLGQRFIVFSEKNNEKNLRIS